jgi:hypothetical protein
MLDVRIAGLLTECAIGAGAAVCLGYLLKIEVAILMTSQPERL